MLYRDTIFMRFQELAGSGVEDTPICRALCESAARSVEERLREGVDADAEMERLCMAAAGVAYARWLACAQTYGSGEELRVGEITVKSSVSAGRAAAGEEAYFRQVADLLRPEGFVFATIEEVTP